MEPEVFHVKKTLALQVHPSMVELFDVAQFHHGGVVQFHHVNEKESSYRHVTDDLYKLTRVVLS